MNERIKLPLGLWLGPMAGVTDKVYRLICQEMGCDVTVTEMVSAKAIYYNNPKTSLLLDSDPKEEQVRIQLFGREPELMAEMARRIDNPHIKGFDVNMGCPVPKVVNNGEGSALMKEPKRIGEIVEALVKATDKPVSIKIRAGFTPEDKNAPEVSRIAQESGATTVAIHGRTREEYYSGKADWSIIRAAKEAVTIPIIANGDVDSPEALAAIVEATGCDGAMIGRAAMGNPWIFSQLKEGMNGEVITTPSLEEKIQVIRRHGYNLAEHKGEFIAMREMRKHIAWYTKGMRHATTLRGHVNTMETCQDMDALLNILMDTAE